MTVVLTLIGLLMYAFIRSTYAIFYGRLGIAPEDVGLGYTQVLSQSVVGIVLFALLLAGFLAIAAVGLWLVTVPPAVVGIAAARRLPLPLPVIFLVFATVYALVAWLVWTRPFIPVAVTYVMYAVVAGLAYGVLVGRRARLRASPLSGSSFSLARAEMVAIRKRLPLSWANAAGLVLLCLFFVFELLLLEAASDARYVKRGAAAGTFTIRGIDFPILRSRAERARVSFASVPPPWIAAECLMYLGSANGMTVFYGVRGDRVVRIPTGDVFVSTDSNAGSCPELVPLGKSIMLTGRTSDIAARVAVTAVSARKGSVRIVVRVTNTGTSRLDEPLVNDVVVSDEQGRVHLPDPAGSPRVTLDPEETWRGSVSFQIPPSSRARLAEITLGRGRASNSAQWDLSGRTPP